MAIDYRFIPWARRGLTRAVQTVDALGVDAAMGKGALGQYLYPFHAWAGSLRRLAVGARTRQ